MESSSAESKLQGELTQIIEKVVKLRNPDKLLNNKRFDS